MNAPLAAQTAEIVGSVRAGAESILPRMKEIRRYLHRRPELSEQEYETTAFLAELAADLGLNSTFATDHRGLTVDVKFGKTRSSQSPTGNHLRRVAVRGDIDALPIQTQLRNDYASRNDGVMHACGHDAHTAIVWGVLAILRDLAASGSSPLGFDVRAIFQPAEETSTGGKHMIASGALIGVDAAIALHVDPTRLVGTVGVRDGALTAGCDTFTCSFQGRGGHGARPHLTDDLVDAMVSWVSDIYRRVPRSTDSLDGVVINVGRLNSGIAPNVVPSEGELAGTLRSLSMPASRNAMTQMHKISDAIASTHGCDIELRFGQHTPPVLNDPETNRCLADAARRILGESNVRAIEKPSMGGEDFSFIAAEVPSAMMRLGVASIEVGTEPLHTPKFDIDEQALFVGASTLALAAIELSQNRDRNGAVQ